MNQKNGYGSDNRPAEENEKNGSTAYILGIGYFVFILLYIAFKVYQAL